MVRTAGARAEEAGDRLDETPETSQKPPRAIVGSCADCSAAPMSAHRIEVH